MTTGLKCYEFFETNVDGTRGRKTASIISTDFYAAIAQRGNSSEANSDMDWDSFYSAANDDYDEVVTSEY